MPNDSDDEFLARARRQIEFMAGFKIEADKWPDLSGAEARFTMSLENAARLVKLAGGWAKPVEPDLMLERRRQVPGEYLEYREVFKEGK